MPENDHLTHHITFLMTENRYITSYHAQNSFLRAITAPHCPTRPKSAISDQLTKKLHSIPTFILPFLPHLGQSLPINWSTHSFIPSSHLLFPLNCQGHSDIFFTVENCQALGGLTHFLGFGTYCQALGALIIFLGPGSVIVRHWVVWHIFWDLGFIVRHWVLW